MEKKEIVRKLVKREFKENEKEELIDMLLDNPIAIDIDKKEEKNMTVGDKMADKISAIAGSWTFIIIFILFLIFWIILNTHIIQNLDPYPFILLNLLLSCIAAIQAPIIMMSQHREAKKDSIRNQNDYITDLKSELILEDLHHKIEMIIKNQKKILDIIDNALEEETK